MRRNGCKARRNRGKELASIPTSSLLLINGNFTFLAMENQRIYFLFSLNMNQHTSLASYPHSSLLILRWHWYSLNLRFHQMKYWNKYSVWKCAWDWVQVVSHRLFPSCPSLFFKARLCAKPLVQQWFFVFMQIKLIFARKVLDTIHVEHSLVLKVRICETIAPGHTIGQTE